MLSYIAFCQNYNTMRKKLLFICLINLSLSLFAQNLSDARRNDICTSLSKQIQILTRFSFDKPEMIPVYTYQLTTAENILNLYAEHKGNPEIYRKWVELKALITQNKEIVDFMSPRMGDWFYRKAVSANANKNCSSALEYLAKAIEYDRFNIMAHYEWAKIDLDSGYIIRSTERSVEVLATMNPSEEERLLFLNLIAYAYDKNIIQAIALADAGKYAFAVDILEELNTFCSKDIFNICNKKLVQNTLERCQKGIYQDHVFVVERAKNMGEYKVAGDFAENTYEYFSKHRSSISDTADFNELTHSITQVYLEKIKDLKGAKNDEVRQDLIRKTQSIAAIRGKAFEEQTLKSITAIVGSNIDYTDRKLDSIENALKPQGYTVEYADYIKDTLGNPQAEIEKIQENFIPSANNKHPKESLATKSTQTKTISKILDEKFYETKSYLTVNNYDKALEILESANKLAKIDAEKDQVEFMYKTAIREITARRMAAAEYALFQGNVNTSDSLVNLTNELIKTYHMDNDSTIVKIMNSYLRALDQKVCEKKQEEINTFEMNILNYMKLNDYYTADAYIEKAMMVKGSSECRLDKSRIRRLKKQIAKPIEYVEYKKQILPLLEQHDTIKFIKEYANLEQFYQENELWNMDVNHIALRTYLSQSNNDRLVIDVIEQLVRHKQYAVALEALGALKDLGYQKKQTKKIQERIGKLMSLEMYKRSVKIQESIELTDKYGQDEWYKYFNKTYKKYLIRWEKDKGREPNNFFVKLFRRFFG